jgi:hypothetical protein
MEPIYTVIIALILSSARGSTKEEMSHGFYVGGLIIILAIFVNAYIKKQKKSKEKLSSD